MGRPSSARPHRTSPVPSRQRPAARQEADVLVIGAGVLGACLAYYLSRAGQDVLVVDRDDVNLQASGANAGSLHVQLLSFDFGAQARRPAAGRPRDTLPLGPLSVALWQELAAGLRRGLRGRDHRRPDGRGQRSRNGIPAGQGGARTQARHRGRRSSVRPSFAASRRRCPTSWSAPNTRRRKARSIRCAPPMRCWSARAGRARVSCAAPTSRRSSDPATPGRSKPRAAASAPGAS